MAAMLWVAAAAQLQHACNSRQLSLTVLRNITQHTVTHSYASETPNASDGRLSIDKPFPLIVSSTEC
jgi:hypothetical protein